MREHMKVIGGESYLDSVGVLWLAYAAYKDDNKEPAKQALMSYCKALAMAGYGGDAAEIMEGLEGMERKSALDWLESTYHEYLNGTNIAEIIGWKIKRQKTGG